MIAGIGVDIVEIARLDAALRRTPGLAERLFTVAERILAAGRRAPGGTLAGSFAAKEALAEVLGAPAGLQWTDAEVLRNEAVAEAGPAPEHAAVNTARRASRHDETRERGRT